MRINIIKMRVGVEAKQPIFPAGTQQSPVGLESIFMSDTSYLLQ